jgi:hypothetical protein
MTPEQRRAWVAAKDQAKRYASQRRARRNHERRNPEKVAAREAVQKAIRKGLLTEQPCEECGAKAQAHHEDYSKPLDVIWLCPIHHKKRHKDKGAGA